MNSIKNNFYSFFNWIKSGCPFGIGWGEKEEDGFYFAKFFNTKFCFCGFGWQKYRNFFLLDLGILKISSGKEMIVRKSKRRGRVFFEI